MKQTSTTKKFRRIIKILKYIINAALVFLDLPFDLEDWVLQKVELSIHVSDQITSHLPLFF